jgi:glucokinase
MQFKDQYDLTLWFRKISESVLFQKLNLSMIELINDFFPLAHSGKFTMGEAQILEPLDSCGSLMFRIP